MTPLTNEKFKNLRVLPPFANECSACPVCRGGTEAAPTRPTHEGTAEFIVRRMRAVQVDGTGSRGI